MSDRTIAVIGGGIGGLTAALAFAQQGARVRVYEQAPALTEVGAGLQISPNGARVLDALGVSKNLEYAGIMAAAAVPTDARNGRAIARFDLSKQLPSYRFYHRAALLDGLAQACARSGVDVHLGERLDCVQADGSFVYAGHRVAPDFTIGADGLHSVLRPVLNGPEKPFFTGQVAWRAIVPFADAPAEARIWMAPGRHVVTYPLDAQRLNIVAVQERAAWAEEGWHHEDSPENLQNAFADTAPELRNILARVAKTHLWGLFRHAIAQKWTDNAHIALVGDAAHPTLPFLAQGANLAIEDGYVLAAAIAGNDSLGDGLQAFQNARKPRVETAIKAANANARNYHLDGIQAFVAHRGLAVLGRFAPDVFLNRLSWLYDHDVTAQDYQLAAV